MSLYQRLSSTTTICRRTLDQLQAIKQYHTSSALLSFFRTEWFAPEAVISPATGEIEKLPSIKHEIPDKNENVEVSTAEWHFVERLFPKSLVTQPKLKPGEVAPSGFRLPTAKLGDHPYYVGRTSNFMPRVHLKMNYELETHVTIVSGIEGDIFQLARDLKQLLTGLYGYEHVIIIQILEPHLKIMIRKDFVSDVKNFLMEKGF